MNQLDYFKGYGFKVYVSDESLRQFILKHKDTIAALGDNGKELVIYTINTPVDEFNPKEDFFDWENEGTEDLGLYGVIADVMRRETGISFEYRSGSYSDDPDADDIIIFPETYPWKMSDTDKSLTEDALKDICKHYIEDLGGELIPEYLYME